MCNKKKVSDYCIVDMCLTKINQVDEIACAFSSVHQAKKKGDVGEIGVYDKKGLVWSSMAPC